ncbi:MAG: hypothetical protein EPN84_13405 [Legionella sp.]|nr:MAG: hypothetical protein EPN84_13405 [Legionella sp.]
MNKMFFARKKGFRFFNFLGTWVAVFLLGISFSSYSAGSKWVHNVTGGGEDSYPNQNNKPTFKISLNAKINEEGLVKGYVEWWFLDGRPASFGNVYCMEVRNNRAYIGYKSLGGQFGGYGIPGNSVLLALEDNGEGSNAYSDRQSFIYYVNFPTYTCTNFVDFIESQGDNGFPVIWLHGNVQIR